MKIKKSDLFQLVQEQAEIIAELSGMVELNKMSIIKLENEREQPKPKQLDQSIFDGLDEKWRWFGVNSDGSTIRATNKPKINISNNGFILLIGESEFSDDNYDASDWQNSAIDREVAK